MLLCLCSLTALAADFTVNYINYNITSTEKLTVEVTSGISYEGDIVIPEIVEWDGEEYHVTGIGENAFKNCYDLMSVTIPNSITSIGNNAFWGCRRLTEVVSLITEPFPINKEALQGLDTSKILLFVPIGTKDTYQCTGAWGKFIVHEQGDGFYVGGINYHITSAEEQTVEVEIGVYYNGNVVIPDFVEWKGKEYRVKGIGECAFHACSGLANVSIPSTVTYIGNRAFEFCDGLLSITIPSSVTSISKTAFLYTSLASISVDPGNGVFDSRDNCNAIIQTEYNELLFGCKNTIIPNTVTAIGYDAFCVCTGLTSITIPNSVTSIGSYAFQGCTNLNSISIPNSVTSIGKSAFYGCSSLPVENGIRYADTYVVAVVDKSLETYSIKEGTRIIGYDVFADCTSLTSISLPNGLTSIYSGAFKGCCRLESITIPNSVTFIDNNAFRESGLTSITIPNSVTSIGNYAFKGCCALTSVSIPNSVTHIGSYAFEGCSGLSSVTIPRSVKGLGVSAFVGCTGLQIVYSEIDLPYPTSDIFSPETYSNATLSVPYATKSLLQTMSCWNKFTNIVERYTAQHASIHVEEAGTLKNYISDAEKYEIEELTLSGELNGADFRLLRDMTGNNDKGEPTEGRLRVLDLSNVELKDGGEPFLKADDVCWQEKYGYYSHAINCSCLIEDPYSLPNSLFMGCTSLISISLPKTITNIEEFVFFACQRLTSISFPDGLESIVSSDAFYNTPWVENLPEGIVYAGNVVFRYQGEMPPNITIELKEGTLGIANRAFMNCSGLLSISLPSSLKRIGGYAFDGCSNLNSISIPSSVVSIGSYAFRGTPWLDNQPDGIIYAGRVLYGFKGAACSETTIEIEDGVKGIAGGAFSSCNNLVSIKVPKSVVSFDLDGIISCNKLSSIDVNPDNDYFKSISGVLFNKKGTKILRYPRDKAETDYAIPEGVIYISKRAFHSCNNLLSIAMPNSVTVIGYASFYSSKALSSIQMSQSLVSICGQAFSYCSGLSSVSIPQSVSFLGCWGTFNGCSGLTKVSIPDRVTTIGYETFGDCSNLTTITIPYSVTCIGSSAFYGCTGLNEVISLITEPFSISTSSIHTVWYGVNTNDIPLYVPIGTKELYAATEGWNVFKNIIEREGTTQDVTTAIESISEKDAVASPIYNMNGQMIRKGNDNRSLPRGIYIMNGKKVVVK